MQLVFLLFQQAQDLGKRNSSRPKTAAGKLFLKARAAENSEFQLPKSITSQHILESQCPPLEFLEGDWAQTRSEVVCLHQHLLPVLLVQPVHVPVHVLRHAEHGVQHDEQLDLQR